MPTNNKHTTVDQLKMLAQRTKTELGVLETEIGKKQDKLVFNTAYNKDTNKAATMADVQGAVEGLKGAMHFIGDSETDPTVESTPGTQDGPSFSDEAKLADPSLATYTAQAGDVVTFGTKEYLYTGGKWREYGDEGSHAIKGSIKNADIAADAAIAQSKIANLEDDLAEKATKVEGENAKTDEILIADGNGDMVASGKKLGGSTLSGTPDGNTVATEAAVADAISGQAIVVASVNGEGGAKGLMSAADKEKLDGFEQATDEEVQTMLNDVFGEPDQSGT